MKGSNAFLILVEIHQGYVWPDSFRDTWLDFQLMKAGFYKLQTIYSDNLASRAAFFLQTRPGQPYLTL